MIFRLTTFLEIPDLFTKKPEILLVVLEQSYILKVTETVRIRKETFYTSKLPISCLIFSINVQPFNTVFF